MALVHFRFNNALSAVVFQGFLDISSKSAEKQPEFVKNRSLEVVFYALYDFNYVVDQVLTRFSRRIKAGHLSQTTVKILPLYYRCDSLYNTHPLN